MSKLIHRFAALCVTAAVLFAVGSARAEARVFYVDANSTGAAAPYSAWETAAATIADALDAARTAVVTEQTASSAEIRIKSGTSYAETGFALDFHVAIIGDSGNPEDVEIVDAVNGSRAFEITHADAKVANLTISGTGLNGSTATSISSDHAGGHIKMSKGTVENCVITGGRAAKSSALCGSGGNVWMSGGTLTHTKVFKGSCNYQSGGTFDSHGAGIYAEGSAIIDNCLVAGNGHPTERNLANGIYAKGNVKIVNCTIAANSQKGLCVDASTVKVVNTIICGHGTTDITGGNLSCYRYCAAASANAQCATWQVISVNDFVDYFGGDYRLNAASAAIDFGTADDAWMPQPVAETDLAGNNRQLGSAIDLGCYELDPSIFSVGGYASDYATFENANITFHASTKGGGDGPVKYQWNFGNGIEVTTDQENFSYAYPTSGLFAASVVASKDDGATWSAPFALGAKIVVAPPTMYLDTHSTSPLYPYKTKATAATNLADLFGALTNNVSGGRSAFDHAEIRVCEGKHALTGITLNDAISIVGDTGDPKDVEIVDAVNGSRCFTITHADAKVANLTISGTGRNADVQFESDKQQGGHIWMSAGTITNCVITGGRATKAGYYYGGQGGNVWMSGGTLTHTKVLNGSCNYYNGSLYNDSKGAGIYAQGSAIIDNCLVAGNGHPTEGNWANGIYAKGNVKVVNCTIIANSQKGLYVDATTVKVANTVIYGHGATDINGQMGVYSHCAAAVTNASCATWSVISSGDFVSYQGGDYHLSAATSLIDAGTCNETWVPQPQATEDLDGFMRVSGDEIDVGCYEFDQSKVNVAGYASVYASFEGSNVVFHAAATGGSGSFEYQWDFGDGTIITTDQADYSYSYPTSGLFRIRLAARETGGSDGWTPWFETAERMVVAPPAMYLDTHSTNPVYPYKTKATAATNLADLFGALTNNVSGGRLAFDHYEIRVCEGKHALTGITLNDAISIIGDTGDPEDVEIVDAVNGSRAFEITHADAKVANLTISGTGLNGQEIDWSVTRYQGGHIKMSKGTVENCVITGGRAARPDTIICGQGGNVWMSGGWLVRTKVEKGSCNYRDQAGVQTTDSQGAGVYAEGTAIIDNCLVAGNGYPTEKNQANGIYAKGNVKIVNCTIIANSQKGLYVDSSTVKVANTVIYGHGTTDINGQMGVYSHCAAAVTNASCATWSVVSSGDFVGYQGGDYHLSAATSLIDAGTRDEAWVPQPQATEDLDGFMRVSGDEIDVGCYEFDQSKVNVAGYASVYASFEGSNVVFHAAATGGSGSFEYQWDFGDGTIITTDQADYAYAYPTSGLFRVRLAARETGGSDGWTPWFETAERMVVAPPTMYLDTHSTNPVYPYKTKATAATNLADLFGALTNNVSGGRSAFDHYEIRVCEGKHELTGITLNDAISIVGDTGDPKDVEIVDAVNGSRAFEITHADAKVANLTISGTGLNGQEIDWSVTRYQGGHIKMSNGMVENCVITGGRAARPDTTICGQGGNVWMSGGRLVRTRVEKGSCNYRDQAEVQTTHSQGAGVYAEGSAIIENCLIAGNGHPTEKNLANGIYAKGNVKIVNCTIVTNSQKAVYLDSANVRVVNTVLFGNGNTIENEFGDNGRTNQFSHCASAVANGGDPDGRVIDEKAFWHYDRLAEDVKFLRAASGSKLISGGTKWAEYEAAGAISTLDLLGNPRLIGKRLDIGAIEGAVPGMAVRIR